MGSRQAVGGALMLLGAALKPNGRLLFLERETIGLPAMAREYGFSVQSESEGGFDVGVATKRTVGKGKKRPPAPKPVAIDPSKGGFGAAAASGKSKKKPTAEEKAERKALKQKRTAAAAGRSDN